MRVLLVLWIGACGGARAQPEPVVIATTPREMVVQVLEVGIGQVRPDVIRKLIGPTYRQHNPRVPDGPGGLLGFVERLRDAPAAARPRVRVVRTIVDGEYVVSHAEYRRRGVVAGFDMFRVAGGKLVEHWDAGRPAPAKTASGHGMTDGETRITDLHATDANKALVRRFAQELLVERRFDRMADFFDGDRLVQHDPVIADGALAWRDAPRDFAPEEVLRVLGEGSFVVVQFRGRVAGGLAVGYDSFRLEGGKIVEHWSVYERVPSRSRNDNGMF